MKRVSMILIATLILMFAVGSVFAGQNCGGQAPAVTTSATTCATMTMEERAKLCGMSVEECKELCGDGKDCGVTMISVKGMTCSGCEGEISSVLAKVEGVNHVVKVDHKEGLAIVCTLPDKCQPGSLTKAITAKGYTAEIIPAVAKVTTVAPKGGCNPVTCASAAKKCCPSKAAPTAKDGKASGSK